MGVFLRDPSPYLREFRRKLRTARSTSATEEWTWHLPSTSFWAQPLVGRRTDSFDIHALPGIRTRDLWCSSRLSFPLYRLVSKLSGNKNHAYLSRKKIVWNSHVFLLSYFLIGKQTYWQSYIKSFLGKPFLYMIYIQNTEFGLSENITSRALTVFTFNKNKFIQLILEAVYCLSVAYRHYLIHLK